MPEEQRVIVRVSDGETFPFARTLSGGTNTELPGNPRRIPAVEVSRDSILGTPRKIRRPEACPSLNEAPSHILRSKSLTIDSPQPTPLSNINRQTKDALGKLISRSASSTEICPHSKMPPKPKKLTSQSSYNLTNVERRMLVVSEQLSPTPREANGHVNSSKGSQKTTVESQQENREPPQVQPSVILTPRRTRQPCQAVVIETPRQMYDPDPQKEITEMSTPQSVVERNSDISFPGIPKDLKEFWQAPDDVSQVDGVSLHDLKDQNPRAIPSMSQAYLQKTIGGWIQERRAASRSDPTIQRIFGTASRRSLETAGICGSFELEAHRHYSPSELAIILQNLAKDRVRSPQSQTPALLSSSAARLAPPKSLAVPQQTRLQPIDEPSLKTRSRRRKLVKDQEKGRATQKEDVLPTQTDEVVVVPLPEASSSSEQPVPSSVESNKPLEVEAVENSEVRPEAIPEIIAPPAIETSAVAKVVSKAMRTKAPPPTLKKKPPPGKRPPGTTAPQIRYNYHVPEPPADLKAKRVNWTVLPSEKIVSTVWDGLIDMTEKLGFAKELFHEKEMKRDQQNLKSLTPPLEMKRRNSCDGGHVGVRNTHDFPWIKGDGLPYEASQFVPDFSALLDNFFVNATTPPIEIKATPRKGAGFLDHRRVQNLEISLKGLGVYQHPESVIRAVVDLELPISHGLHAELFGGVDVPDDTKTITISSFRKYGAAELEIFQGQLPNDEELAALHTAPEEAMSPGEKLVRRWCTEIPRFRQKVECARTLCDYSANIDMVTKRVTTLEQAVADLIRGTEAPYVIQSILALVLKVGNYLNYHTNRQALGITLGSLDALKKIKSTDNTYTLLNVVASIIDHQYPSIWKLFDQATVRSAEGGQILPEETLGTIEKLEKSLRKVRIELSDHIDQHNERFARAMSKLVELGAQQLTKLRARNTNVTASMVKLARLFDSSFTTSQDGIYVLSQFAKFRVDLLAARSQSRDREVSETLKSIRRTRLIQKRTAAGTISSASAGDLELIPLTQRTT